MKKVLFSLLFALVIASLSYVSVYAEDLSGIEIEASDDTIIVKSIEMTIEDTTTTEIDLTEESDDALQEISENNETLTQDESVSVEETTDIDSPQTGTTTIQLDEMSQPPVIVVQAEEILSTTTIHIQLETFDATLYNDTFVVTACPNTEYGGEHTLTIWCAINQLAEQKGWSITATWSSYGVTYDIDQYKGNDFSDGMWWGWYSDLTPGMTGINAHLLSQDEHILLVYGIEPSKIIVSEAKPDLHTTTTLEFQKFDWTTFDWIPNTSSTFVINEQDFFDKDGIYELDTSTTSPYTVSAHKKGYITPESILITPQAIPSTDNTDKNTTPQSNNSENDIPLETIDDEMISITVEKILDYLKSQQDETGKIQDGNMTDWAIMSFGAQGQYADDISRDGGKSLLEYEKSYNIDDPSDINICSTYARHALALLAAGVADTDPAISGLNDKMNTDCYQNHLFGLNGINDDVFGLLALLELGADPSAKIIVDIVDTIINWQLETGAFSWPDWTDPTQKVSGDDITGASINALVYAKNNGVNVNQDVIDNARAYLKTTQQSDGGWGLDSSDIMTTSWVLMGLNALEETDTEWTNDHGYTPLHPLVSQLNNEGYYESSYGPTGTLDWFAMKHAVPALLKKSWPIVLEPIVKDFSKDATFNYGSGSRPITPKKIEITTTTTSLLDTITSSTLKHILMSLPNGGQADANNLTPTSTEDVVDDPNVIDVVIVENVNPITEVLGEKIEKKIIEPKTPAPTSKKIENIQTSTENVRRDLDLSLPEADDNTKPEKTSEKSIINKTDIRNIFITIAVFVLGFIALKYFKILV